MSEVTNFSHKLTKFPVAQEQNLKPMKASYPLIHKFGIKVEDRPFPHILSEDLDKILTPQQRRQFSEYFGVQTQLLRDDGRGGMYLHDVEAVLERIFNKRLTGTQLIWD